MSTKPHWKYTASNSDQKLMLRERYKQGQVYVAFSFSVPSDSKYWWLRNFVTVFVNGF